VLLDGWEVHVQGLRDAVAHGIACLPEDPKAARSEMMRWTSSMAAASMPRVGSSRIRIRGRVASHWAMTTFCWWPPQRLWTVCSRPAALLRRLRRSGP